MTIKHERAGGSHRSPAAQRTRNPSADYGSAALEADIRAYERLRRRRFPRRTRSAQPQIPTESEYLLDFALKWLPHGGASDDELLVQFGMTRTRFAETLRSHLPESTCDQDTAHRLLRVYRTS